MSPNFFEMVATEIRNLFLIDHSLQRVKDTETSKSHEIYKLFFDAIYNSKNGNRIARKILNLKPKDNVEVIFGFREIIRSITSHFLFEMIKTMADNSNNNQLINFLTFLGFLFKNEIINFEDFKIYVSTFHGVALIHKKPKLIENLLTLVADKLKEKKITKDKFLELLDREFENRKIPDELDEDNQSYKFDSDSYESLNIEKEAQHIAKKFAIYLDNPSSDFDLQLIIKGNEQSNLYCAAAICQRAIALIKNSENSSRNLEELVKIVAKIQNIPRCSYDKNVESICTTLNAFLQTSFQKIYKDEQSFKKSGFKLQILQPFMKELKKYNMSFPFSVKKTLKNGMKKNIEISSSGLPFEEVSFEGFSFAPLNSKPRFNVYYEDQPELTAASKSIKILFHHLNNSTFTSERLQIFIKVTQKMVEKCSNEEKEIFNGKIAEIVDLKLNFYFPSCEFDKTAEYGDENLTKFITILCELFNLEMIDNEIFMKFAFKLYENVKNDDWKKLQQFFIQLFNASCQKIQENSPEIFSLMSELNKELLEVKKIIENFNGRTKFDKNFKNLIESGKKLQIFQTDEVHVPKYIANELVSYACSLENPTAVIEALKKVKNMKNIYIDEAINRQFDIACKNFFKTETILNLSLICCLRELIYNQLMTRRGLARIYKTLLKYFKICETLSKSIEVIVKYTLPCFSGQQLLENDVKDILEVMLKFCENYPSEIVTYCKGVPEIISFLKKILQNHEENVQSIVLRQQREILPTPEEERENFQDITDDEMKLLCKFSINELLDEISELPTINNQQLIVNCSLENDIKIQIESNEIENSSKTSIVFNMNEEFQVKFKEMFVAELINELKNAEDKESVVKLMAALINSKVINSDHIRKLIKSFMPLNCQNLKLLNNFLSLIKETLIETDEKSSLNKFKNQLMKLKKKKNGRDIRSQVLEKILEIFMKIDKKNQQEEAEDEDLQETARITIEISNNFTESSNNFEEVSISFIESSNNPTESFKNSAETFQEFLESENYQNDLEISSSEESNFQLDSFQQKHSEKLLELLENSPTSSSSQKTLSNTLKIELIEFIKNLSEQEELTTNFIVSLMEILLPPTFSESSNFAVKVFMKIFGGKLQGEDYEKFYKFSEFQMKYWRNAEKFDEISDFDEILIDFYLNESTIDEFIARLWMILLQNGTDKKLVLIINKCLAIHEDFKRRLINFMVARCETFQMLNSEILNKEKVKERLGKVAVFVVELYKMQVINDYCFTNMLTSKLIEKIPENFVTKIVEIFAEIKFDEEQMIDLSLQKIILHFEWMENQNIEKKMKEVYEILYEN
ncbi:hypothetical protein PVAND_015464 [Polypedilum vanderplanki]|uniref:Uncharacterized protein n=1 Tax=Polypedilum vanderplanki TaxID=319348 RepID=A0A9J6BCB0_POLVA|nr:hypothetical protein PVAND_015464 [Polypedilum vanderplanki]